jgi:nucleoside-diphosphate-sugar epimerase
VREGHPVRCLVRASSDTSPLDGLDVEIAVGDLTNAGSLARAVDGCDYVFHCGALVSDWATRQEIEQTNVQGTRSLLDAAADAKVRRFVHFSTTDVYGYPDRAGIDETYAATRFRNWYAETKLKAEAEVRRAEQARGLDAVILRPATVYGPGSVEVVGEIARAIRARNMLLVDKGRAVAGLCYVDNLLDAAVLALGHDGARGHAFNVTDGLGVTWREFTDGLAEGLGCASVRWSVPYWMANGIGFSLEHGYRLLRRTTGLHAAPLLSRQAVHVLGNSHDFSNRRAREMLGWEPRVEYPDGLQATLDWLTSEYFKRA